MYAQVRSSTPREWLALGFPVLTAQMVGATAVIGSTNTGVSVWALSGKFADGVTPLDSVWQTLSGASFETVGGETVLTFVKRLDENVYAGYPLELQRPSDQDVILPNDAPTDLIFAEGTSAFPSYHFGRTTATLWLGLTSGTPPPLPPPPTPPPPTPPPSPPYLPPPPLPPPLLPGRHLA